MIDLDQVATAARRLRLRRRLANQVLDALRSGEPEALSARLAEIRREVDQRDASAIREQLRGRTVDLAGALDGAAAGLRRARR